LIRPVKWKMPAWLPVIATIIIPGSGYVLLGKPMRSLQLLFFIGFFGFITYNLTDINISPIGRFAGGFAVWALSVVEVQRMVKLRNSKPKKFTPVA